MPGRNLELPHSLWMIDPEATAATAHDLEAMVAEQVDRWFAEGWSPRRAWLALGGDPTCGRAVRWAHVEMLARQMLWLSMTGEAPPKVVHNSQFVMVT